MNYQEYKAKRENLLSEVENLINENKLKESDEKMEEVKELDSQYGKDQANKRAFEDNAYKSVPGFIQDNISSFDAGGGNVKDKVILNKSDKWINRVNINNNDGNLDIGKWFKGITTGDWNNATMEFKNLATTSTGVLIPQVLSARIIDKAREKSLFTTAGVPVVPMDSNNLTLAKVKTDPVFKFKAEGAEATESTMELEGVELKSKTAYGYAYITLEAIRSSQNLESVIIEAFSNALAQTIDKAYIYGQDDGAGGFDSFAPDGILNSSDINSITATAVDYDDIIKAKSKVKQANGEPTVWGLNAKTEEFFSLLKDAQGDYITVPKSVEKLNQIVSNQLIHDETDGSTSLVFDPQALIIGLQDNINIKILEGSDEAIKKGLVAIRIYAMLDCKMLQPKHICKIEGIKEAV